MKFTIFTADCTGYSANCLYPHRWEVTSPETLASAAAKDQVFAEYKSSYRANDNFLWSDVIPMDCDNDHSDNPADWLTAEKLKEIFSDVGHVIFPSRHHMRPKEGKAARPKYHILFPIERCDDAAMYTAVKNALQRKYPFLDEKALDSARFFYGTNCKPKDIVWHEGILSIEETLDERDGLVSEVKKIVPHYTGGSILEGNRNNTMSRFAGRVLKRYGDTDKAREAFLVHAQKCDPPLEDKELQTIWASAQRFFHKKISTSDGYVPPEEYNRDFGASLKPEDFSDIGEARILAREYADELAYTDATDFLRYDGKRWRENRQDAVGAVEEFLDLQLVDARDEYDAAVKALVAAGLPEQTVKAGGKALEKQITPNMEKLLAAYLSAKAYYSFVMRYRNYRNIVNTQNAAKPMLQIAVESLDADENLLNTPCGTYDLRKGLAGLKEHDPLDLITKMTACSPGEDGKQLWEDALATFFCGDRDLIEYVQKTCGMAAVGKVYEEALIIAYGEGRNGKSTFWNTVSKVMGKYAGTISADAMTAGCRRNVQPEIAELKGKRLVIAAELEEGTLLSTSILKQVCSTDPIHAEKKFKDPFDFDPTHTVVLYTNHLPKVRASDDGTWRRLIVIPFHAKIEGKSDIKNYSDYLFTHAGSYIMAWIIEGARKAIEDGFHLERPKEVEDAINEYRGMNDWLGHFLDECCTKGDTLEEKSGELYQEYRNYCIRTGEFTRNNADFVKTLEKCGFNRKKKKTGMWVQGLQLKNTDFID